MTIDLDCFYISDQILFLIKVIELDGIKVIYFKEYFHIQTLNFEVLIMTLIQSLVIAIEHLSFHVM